MCARACVCVLGCVVYLSLASDAMLKPRAAKACGYAKAVPSALASGVGIESTEGSVTGFRVRDVLERKDLATSVKLGGSFSAQVNTGDTKLFVLTPMRA